MATNGAHTNEGGRTENSLEKIKKQLSSSSSSGRYLLQGPLLKRSETLRNWNERWMILDPTSGRMEYKIRRNEPTVKGSIYFDATSSITLSPVNFHGLPKYDGCCFYIGTPQKKDYFLCAETPGAAKAWISTLHATQLVLKAHKDAVNSLSGTSTPNTVTVHTVVAAANKIAMEASGEIEAAMKASLRANLGFIQNSNNGGGSRTVQLEDDLAVMKETLRVKDEELGQLAKDVRSRDATVAELAQKLAETAHAAQDAAQAARTLDEQRVRLFGELEGIRKEGLNQIQASIVKVRESEQKAADLSSQNSLLIKQKDSAEKESQLWRAELAKARDQRAVLEGRLREAEEKIRVVERETEERVREAEEKLRVVAREREELVEVVRALQAQFKRKQGLREESLESSSGSGESSPLTKHIDKSETEDVDKACVVSAGEEDDDIMRVEGDMRIADVREISPEGEEVREISPEGVREISPQEEVREISNQATEEEVDVRVVGPDS